MTTEQIVYDICELSKASNIPFLLLSNPGYKKTFCIRKYAEDNGYHLEVLIGSRSTPEELLGYQVNDNNDRLKHLDSQWWQRIAEHEAKGQPSILFCDEISTCSPQVQGAMLSLIQDRMNNNGDKLPDDCIVIAAANYAKNLAPYMDIMPPTLNRFCIINLTQAMTGLDVVDELFNEPKMEKLSRNELSEEKSEKYLSQLNKLYRNMFIEYSDPKSSKGCLDIHNSSLQDLYHESDDFVYNFISSRTLWNLKEIVKLCIEYGLADEGFISMIVDGLIGEGTGNFDKAQAMAFRNMMHMSFKSLVSSIADDTRFEISKMDDDPDKLSIHDLAVKLSLSTQVLNFSDRQKFEDALRLKIMDRYFNKDKEDFGLFDIVKNDHIFVEEYEACLELFKTIKDLSIADTLLGFLQIYFPIYRWMELDDVNIKMNDFEAFKDYKSALYKDLILMSDKNGPKILCQGMNGALYAFNFDIDNAPYKNKPQVSLHLSKKRTFYHVLPAWAEGLITQ